MSLLRLLGLKEDERPMTVAHAAVATVLPVFMLAAALVGAAFFFLTPLLRYGPLGYVALGILLVLGLSLALAKLARWRGSALVVTERRIFVVRRGGLFERDVTELPLSKVRGVAYRVNGLLPTIFGYGTVIVEMMGSEEPLEMPRLPRPAALQALIADLREQASGGAGDFGEMLQAVSRLDDRKLELLAEEIARTRRHRANPDDPAGL